MWPFKNKERPKTPLEMVEELNKRKTDEDGDEVISAAEVFGITEKQANEYGKRMRAIVTKDKNMTDVAKHMGVPKGMDAYRAFMYGRFVEHHEHAVRTRRMNERVKKLFEKAMEEAKHG